MGSVNSAGRSLLKLHRQAIDAKEDLPPHDHVVMAEKQQPQVDRRAEPRLGAVNATRHSPLQRNTSPEDFIELSSSSSPSSPGDDDVHEGVQLEPPERRKLRLQQLGAKSCPPPPHPVLSSPEGAANILAQPLAHLPPNATRDLNPVNPILLQDLVMDDDEINRYQPLDDFDEFDPLDVRDTGLARLMEEEYHAQAAAQYNDDDSAPGLNQQDIQLLPAMMDSKATCLDTVLMIFPDICPAYVTKIYDTVSKHSDQLVVHILENMEREKPYPKARDTQKTLKRKRDLGEDEETVRKYGASDRPANVGTVLQRYIRSILSMEFSGTPITFIETCLRQNGYRLFSTYRVLEEAERTYGPENPPYNKIKVKRKMLDEYQDINLETSLSQISDDQQRVELLRELQAARRVRKNANSKREEERLLELEEEANLLNAQAEGTMLDCQCCFDDYPVNRMVHCDSEEVLHWFCRGCARQNAETVIGQSKYQLVCMAMEGCTSSFSIAQRSYFLDDKTVIALERNEQEANLRMAGIENLASCPFCPYAAEYPPVEIDKEFRCKAPDCEMVSCRLCNLESHIPKSCEESAKDIGLSVRRQIEEAMSEALIRKCNKCGTPFVKEEGCNKMTCTRNGCHNVQCYVCSKSCTYDHFNDERRGGRAGNCPLFESTAQRHEDEVKKAEREALEKIRTEHPEYTEEDLKVKVSEAVLRDEQRRGADEIRAPLAGPPARFVHLARPGVPPPQLHNMPNYFMQNAPREYRPLLRQKPHGGDIGVQVPPGPRIIRLEDLVKEGKEHVFLPNPLVGRILEDQDPRIMPPLVPRPLLRHAPPMKTAYPEPLINQPSHSAGTGFGAAIDYPPFYRRRIRAIAEDAPDQYAAATLQRAAQHFMPDMGEGRATEEDREGEAIYSTQLAQPPPIGVGMAAERVEYGLNQHAQPPEPRSVAELADRILQLSEGAALQHLNDNLQGTLQQLQGGGQRLTKRTDRMGQRTAEYTGNMERMFYGGEWDEMRQVSENMSKVQGLEQQQAAAVQRMPHAILMHNVEEGERRYVSRHMLKPGKEQ